jgi:hypothetical protein
VLPPVTAVRWKKVAVAPPELGLRAERWTVDDLDFSELSAVAPVEDAPAKQAAVLRFVGSLGLDITDEQVPTTRQVMEHLGAPGSAVLDEFRDRFLTSST